MKRLIIAAISTAFLGFAGLASAEEITGTLQTIDPETRTIILSDGSSFSVGEAVDLDALQPGTEIAVSYEEQDGTKTATEIAPAE